MLRSATFLVLILFYTGPFTAAFFDTKKSQQTFRGPGNFRNSSQTNFQGQAAQPSYSKTSDQNQTGKDSPVRSKYEFDTHKSDLCYYHARLALALVV